MKCGFVAIIGRPSAGKSTLLNTLCQEKVAITSPHPQTTRNAIRGIMNTAEGQIIFVDTPGYHESRKKMNIYLGDLVHRTLSEVDAVLYVVDATRPPGREEHELMKILARSKLPLAVAVNKIDAETPLLREIRGLIISHLHPKAVINVSAIEASNLSELSKAVFDLCPEGEAQYPKDYYTDQLPEFRIAEIIREQAIARSEQELPHALYVRIADMEFRQSEAERKNLWVRAFITVERPSQVGIIVGYQGKRIKELRIAALKELKKIFPWKIHLDLRVKVHAKWRKNDAFLKGMV